MLMMGRDLVVADETPSQMWSALCAMEKAVPRGVWVSFPAPSDDMAGQADRFLAGFPAAEHPHLAEHIRYHIDSGMFDEGDFEFGLDLILDRLATMRDAAEAADRDPDAIELTLGAPLATADRDVLERRRAQGARRLLLSTAGADFTTIDAELTAAAERLGLPRAEPGKGTA